MEMWYVDSPEVDLQLTRQRGIKMRFRLLSQWGAIFAFGRQYNWIEFTVIELDFDFDKIASRARIILGLLGFNLIISIPIGKSFKSFLRMRDLEDRAMGGNFLTIEEAMERLRRQGIEMDFQVPETLVEELERKKG